MVTRRNAWCCFKHLSNLKFHNGDAITFTAPYNSEATEKFWGTLAKVFVKDQFALVKTTATTVAATSMFLIWSQICASAEVPNLNIFH